MKPVQPHTFCAICHRVVYVTDVDAQSRCCFCAPAEHEVKPSETPARQRPPRRSDT